MEAFDRLRLGLTVLVTLAIWSLLVWQHFHDGVPSHNLLADPSLPEVSNGYGAVLLPVLTWELLSLTRRRVHAMGAGLASVVIGLTVGIAYGAAMTMTYFGGQDAITGFLFFGLLPLALVLPAYRPECLLGFVLGMSVGFGAVLPTLFGVVMALATLIIHRGISLPLQRLLGLRKSPGQQTST
jgi:hypothetical protein